MIRHILTPIFLAPALAGAVPLKNIDLETRVNYLQVKIPGERTLGLAGLHELAKLNHWLYAGVGGFAAVKGNNSGFFAMGLDAEIMHPIYKNLWGDVGGFIGSGGGNGLASRIGNGGFYELHAALQYNLGVLRVGAGYSHIKFTDAPISDNQFTLMTDIPVNLTLSSADQLFDNLRINQPLTFHQNYISATASYSKPRKGTKNINNVLMDGHVGLIGFEYGHYLNPYNSVFLRTSGAVTGNKNGYAQALGGYAYTFNPGNPVQFSARLSAGSGGGGSVDTGSGLIIEPQVGIETKPTPSIGIQALGGYLWAPSSGYRAIDGSIHLKYYFNVASLGQGQASQIPVSNNQWRIRLGNQTYFNPQRENTNAQKDVNLLGLKLDFFPWECVYFTGQTSFAYTGNAAGYFSGMIGLGAQTPNFNKVYAYAELLGGAAGGAGFKIGTGKMIEPLVGIGLHLTPQFGAYASFGRTVSPNNDLSTTTVDAGLSWRFGLLTG